MSYNYNFIESVLEVDERCYVKNIKSILSHYNYVHCGVEILPMSKTTMSCVFDSANYCNVNIYYQDADSTHLNYDGVDKNVKKVYRKIEIRFSW